MAFNVLTRKVSDQLNICHLRSLRCVQEYCHLCLQQQSIKRTRNNGPFKNTEEKNKRKNNDTDNCKAFWGTDKSKKIFSNFLVHRFVAQDHKQATYNSWKITVSLKPWTLLQINVTWDSKTFIRAPVNENLCVELEKL